MNFPLGAQARWRKLFLLAASFALLRWLVGSALAPFIYAAITIVNFGILRAVGTARLQNRAVMIALSALQFAPLFAAKFFPAFLPLPTLPTGMFALQSASFLWDLARGEISALPSLTDYALYLLYLPKFFNGPLERFGLFSRQADMPVLPIRSRLVPAAYLLASGLFKKQILADVSSPVTYSYFYRQSGHSGTALVLMTYLCVLEFYCMFSGYTDLARGASLLAGIRLTPNFLCPFFSASPQEFWQRWHRSFSLWLRDYVYYEVFFLLKSVTLAVFLTFLAMGLIDGMKLGAEFEGKYLALGAYCGIVMAAYAFFKPALARIGSALSPPQASLATFASRLAVFHFFCFAALLQRAPDLGFLKVAFGSAVTFPWSPLASQQALTLAFVAVPVLLLDGLLARHDGDEEKLGAAELALAGLVMTCFAFCRFHGI